MPLDTGSRLIVRPAVGRGTLGTRVSAGADVDRRTDGGLPALVTTDDGSAHPTARLRVYGVPKGARELSAEEKKALDYVSMPARDGTQGA